MALILALETSSTICSVALYQNQEFLALTELQLEKSHSSHTTVIISQLLENCGLTLQDLSAVAVSGGPGSYTGLRIGSAMAKGLCYSLDIPLIEISTLHALAYSLIQVTPNPENYLYCPMLDARRMEVYSCVLNSDLQELLPVSPIILTNKSFEDFTSQNPVIFLGSGADKFQKLIENSSQALFNSKVSLSAKPVGALAYHKYINQQFEDVAYYEPFYLKEVYITASNKS
ncbi:tRNA (adenosine(37)-N6)-threonylcarbamoyltransferase complex dimerization subunit type 1 TsaB [Adhaeribacter radiodurans]|uniref:tRNA (Adenosine(37)-N6)-threonylcarbamoyltransferase complex dimerization subunit type 1 TsaB n=1 Tax=Adhaeribacter radiodurans TaxID=2745197 RepID=A0A7L7LAI8_9BACT|nr:tRNA (adenosine(37)-N6)-threonylcarbamoyltransferase complex dimerization subunit type 1 TsaB [Adhaeribacter radiodurans]QMU29565.1 tRNA (adenosine(37)-N6)-threonylcarbamoyltransferase complex dimerization subunit type 1 TsaB [Adhaeribacter radiodurans]